MKQINARQQYTKTQDWKIYECIECTAMEIELAAYEIVRGICIILNAISAIIYNRRQYEFIFYYFVRFFSLALDGSEAATPVEFSLFSSNM